MAHRRIDRLMRHNRRQFLKYSTAGAITASLPARWIEAADLPADRKIKLRFAVASDIHYGQSNTPYAAMTDDLIRWINLEKQTKGLDALFLNGDLTHDSAPQLLALRQHLSKLEVPYHVCKGNHDFVDGNAGSPTESWETIWGVPANHTIKIGEFVFIMADTSAPHQADVYRAADIDWLKEQLAAHRDAPGIFMVIHIQQRKHGVDGWPKFGVHDPQEVPKSEAVMSLLESTPNVRAVFHGHNHSETGVYLSAERRYFFGGRAGGSWGVKRGYRMVEIDDQHRITSYHVNAEDDVITHTHDVPA
jgi:Icc protein